MTGNVAVRGPEPAARPAGFDGALAEAAFAYERVPFFQSHLAAAGLRPEDIRGPEDWSRIPPTARADYRRNFPQRVLARGKNLREPGTLKTLSSGHGDDRIATIAHISTLDDRMLAAAEANPPLRDVLRAGGSLARYAAPGCSDIECANPHTAMRDRVLPDGTLVLPATTDPLATPETLLARAAEELRTYAPRRLTADPTHLALLCRHLDDPPPLEAVVLTHVPATRTARRRIGECLGPDVVVAEVVSMSEFGWLAVECPLGRTHLNTTSFYVEFLDGAGRPAGPGELAELVVTSIGDRLLPHIRYRTGDLYRVTDEDCPCGSRHPVCRHDGRRETLLTVPGRSLPVGARDVDEALGDRPDVEVYQVRQYREDACRFQYVPRGAAAPPDLGRLRDLLGPRMRLEVEATRYIPAQPSGRLPPCLSDIPLGL